MRKTVTSTGVLILFASALAGASGCGGSDDGPANGATGTGAAGASGTPGSSTTSGAGGTGAPSSAGAGGSSDGGGSSTGGSGGGSTVVPTDCTMVTCHYVRAGASGSGADWDDALPELPSDLERGAVYFVASGTYPGHTFADGDAGADTITIKKALDADHGTAAGWEASYGDGQAVFSGTLDFAGNHYVVDGQIGGGPGSWKDGFGFKVAVTDVTSGPGVAIGDGFQDITLEHFEVEGDGGDGDGVFPSNDALAFGGSTDILVSHAYLHDVGRCLIFGASSNTTYEFVYGGKFESTPGQHSEIASLWAWGGSPVENVRFANCVWSHLEGTGGIIMEGDGLEVYGNVFYRPPGESFGTANGAIGTWTVDDLTNVKIYNNSFIDLDGMPAFGILDSGDTGSVMNNVFYKSGVGSFGGWEHDYNVFVDVGDAPSEPHGASASADPFEDYVNLEFGLKAPTGAGTPLGAPYDVDPTGAPRGGDGVWDRGAYEH